MIYGKCEVCLQVSVAMVRLMTEPGKTNVALPVPLSTASNSLDSISMTCNSALGKWTDAGLCISQAYHQICDAISWSVDRILSKLVLGRL